MCFCICCTPSLLLHLALYTEGCSRAPHADANHSTHPRTCNPGPCRAPPRYYNRSTWDTDRYNKVLGHLQQVFRPAELADKQIAYFNISNDVQVRRCVCVCVCACGGSGEGGMAARGWDMRPSGRAVTQTR